jgi:hypothetical protein
MPAILAGGTLTAKTSGAPRIAKEKKLDRIYRINGISRKASYPVNPVHPV